MTILIVGGTGSTGLHLAHLLRASSIPVLITSRSGSAPDGFPAVRFDWADSKTFAAPFEKDNNINKVYFIAPHAQDMLSVAKPFIDIAVEKGAKQWVLIGGTSVKKGGPGMGSIHAYLDGKGVDHALLRPTWFSVNFSAPIFASQFLQNIKTKNEFISATGDGRVPFIAPEDIAQAAFEILTTDSKDLKNSEPHVIGPQLFSFDEVAVLLSEVLGRKITHRRLSPEELTNHWVSAGLPKSAAEFLVWLEVRTASGTEEEAFNVEGGKDVKYIGKKTLREYFEENKDVWAPA